MDWFPLLNSLRIAFISTIITFFLGVLAAYYIARLPRVIKGVLDVLLTLPLVLPPTVIGFFLLKFIGPKGALGSLWMQLTQQKLVMVWYAGIFATVVVTFPLMYRTVRGSFEAFDSTLKYAGQTLGRSDSWIFWRVIMPNCKEGLLAGTVLAFARALGEYGATSMVCGYTAGRTATISTTVYQLYREGNDALCYRWVFINMAISFVVMVAVNLLEKRTKRAKKPTGGEGDVPDSEEVIRSA